MSTTPVLVILSFSFLLGGIVGCLTEGNAPADEVIEGFLREATTAIERPALWREIWCLGRWPFLVLLFNKLPWVGLTIPALFFLRGLIISYGITAFVSGNGLAGWFGGVALLGTVCMMSVPVFFLMGTECLLRKVDGERSSPLLRLMAYCTVSLALCGLLDRLVTPCLLPTFLRAIATG